MSDLFKDDDTFLARWLSGELSPQELAEFEKSDAYREYQKIANHTSNLDTPQWDTQKIWNQIEGDESNIVAKKETKLVRMGWITYAIAGCALLVLGYLTLFNTNSIQLHETFATQNETIHLPDGSVVYLNAGSSLQYNTKTFPEQRNLDLKGEAFFEVTKGSAFKVKTDHGDVRVLGTSFNIKSRVERFEVQCFTGSVGVSSLGSAEIQLLKGEKVEAQKGKLQNKSQFNALEGTPVWRNGQSRFNNVLVIEVLNEMERQFDIEIKANPTIENIENYSGGFDHNNLESALQIVCSSINCTYVIDGTSVRITQND
ncbi:MAG: FecR family protein [Saprospiraceae bacterium]|nr:FecR family protein [Saprospiraceae bacterium]